MDSLRRSILSSVESPNSAKTDILAKIRQSLEDHNYQIVDADESKPWGAYFRLNSQQAELFMAEFFPGLTIEEASLGIENAELSPKILLVEPSARLSWQYHDRRAERWHFLNAGAYHKSMSDDPGELVQAETGHEVQFARNERHRLVGAASLHTLVAEIWQHTDPNHPSDEDDIVRLQDDYSR